MKQDPTPADRGDQDELSLPLLMPAQRKHYLIALIIVLILCVALLAVILAVSAHRSAPTLPPDGAADTSPSPDPSPQPPAQQGGTPTPDEPDDSRPSPEQSTDGGAAVPPPTPEPIPTPQTPQITPTDKDVPTETPPIVIEQILLSGSAGLVYRSYGTGTCRVEGIGSCTDACLISPSRSPDGDTVIAIGQEAFAACPWLQAVQIPATIKSIGKSAFADCSSLLLFAVDAANSAYCAQNGVLYSKDGTALLSYPSGRPCPVATIPASVTYISAQAFGASATYQTIVFEGTLAAWRAIRIEDDNSILYTLPKRFAQ